ncbi:MAG TPA: hypothetical protein VFT47_00130 [Vicinamibacterales bacterium]|nr:hypothetical protein [Vicinamibacterales bacterium]
MADVPQGVPVDLEIQNRIRADGLGPPHPPPYTGVLEPDDYTLPWDGDATITYAVWF